VASRARSSEIGSDFSYLRSSLAVLLGIIQPFDHLAEGSRRQASFK
jgi:hypothetical protein